MYGTAWEKLLEIRKGNRFQSIDLLEGIFTSFYELHGDRYFGDDPAIIGGLAFLEDIPVTVIAQYRGKSIDEIKNRNYGMPLPEGYRKSLRLMKQAEKFKRPIICLVDTPGAFPGINAEERGQAEAIARNLYEMSTLKVPIISIITGEGGSGGALALSVSNQLIMFENAVFSVVTPEGCSIILWRDPKLAWKAAEYLKITAQDLFKCGIVDHLLKENSDLNVTIHSTKTYLCEQLRKYLLIGKESIVEQRYEKFRNIGIYN